MRTTFYASAFLVAALLFLAPIISLAQTSEEEDLRTAIQASVLADPRVSEIPPSQLKGLIDTLVQEALAQKMAVSDILWQPARAEAATIGSNGAAAESAACAEGFAGYLCQFNKVFGFEGDNYEIPIILLVVTGLLAAVTWEIRAHHRKQLAKMAKKPAAPIQKLVQ